MKRFLKNYKERSKVIHEGLENADDIMILRKKYAKALKATVSPHL